MGGTIAIKDTGIVHRNSKPHLRGIVGYHLLLVPIANNKFVATFDLGQTVEAFDYHIVVARSVDGGNTRSPERPLITQAPPLTTHTIRTTCLANGLLVGLGGPSSPHRP